MNPPKSKSATLIDSPSDRRLSNFIASCFRYVFIFLYIIFTHIVCLLIFLGFRPLLFSVPTPEHHIVSRRKPSGTRDLCSSELSGRECAQTSEWNISNANDKCRIDSSPSIHQWSCPTDWILKFIPEPFKCNATGCHQWLNPSVVFIPTRRRYFVIIKHFHVTRGFPCGHNFGYPNHWYKTINNGHQLKPSLYTTDLFASHYGSLHDISYPSHWSFSKIEDNGENLWIDCRSFWILARLIVLCRNAKWMEIDPEDFSIINDVKRLTIPGENILTMNNMQIFEAYDKAYVLRSLTPYLEYCEVDLDSQTCGKLNRQPTSLDMVHNTIENIYKTHVHLSACCVKVIWKGKPVFLGAGHYIYGKREIDKFYTNFFFVLSSRPPFLVLAVSSEFQFQEDDPLEGTRPRLTILPDGHATTSGRLQFIVSILLQSRRIILSYTMNDCYPRMVAIPLQQILESLIDLN